MGRVRGRRRRQDRGVRGAVTDHAETWKPVQGAQDLRFPGGYEVSDLGRVRNSRGQILAMQVRKRDGYVCVGLRYSGVRRTVKVHRLVAEAFLPNPGSLPVVDHVAGNRQDNRAVSFRWSDHSANGHNRHQTRAASGLLGAYPAESSTNPWRGVVRVNGKQKHLGVFATAEEAAQARNTYLENRSNA